MMTVPLTRVALVFIPLRINVYLRFGKPARMRTVDARRRVAEFMPASIFCRVAWQANEFGTTRWELMVLSVPDREPVQRVVGVIPGAALLLKAEGPREVPAALRLVDSIETQRIEPADVSPRFWLAMSNRLAARAELSLFGADRADAQRASVSTR